MNCPEWLLIEARTKTIPLQVPALILDTQRIGDVNTAIIGAYNNGMFAEKQPPEAEAYREGRENNKIVTWGEVAAREQARINDILQWAERNRGTFSKAKEKDRPNVTKNTY